ncbi:MAG: hypothetical protein R3D55_13505 [Chloroflexota bacterium]
MDRPSLLQQASYTSGGIHATAIMVGKHLLPPQKWRGEDTGHS